jgi:hypothetical protein
MEKIIRIEEEQLQDYTLKHTYEDNVLVETMKVTVCDGFINQIQLFPAIEPIPQPISESERISSTEEVINVIMMMLM